MSTSVNLEPGFDAVRYGQVLWAARVEGELVGLAWDWREVRRNVIAMADPMTVLSNLTLVDEHGAPLSESHRLICLNSAIFELRWQAPLRQGPDAPVDERLAA